MDAWLNSVQAYQHIPAISAGVVVGDDLVWSKGFGTIDASHTVAATPQTIYSICSISKLFTSIALMQLNEAGKVRLAARVFSKWSGKGGVGPKSRGQRRRYRAFLAHGWTFDAHEKVTLELLSREKLLKTRPARRPHHHLSSVGHLQTYCR